MHFLERSMDPSEMRHQWPSLFISHGAPTYAIEPGLAGAQLREVGRLLGKPRAIVVVSPHWMTSGVEISAMDCPSTIHDFGGFPRELYSLQYRAPGSPSLARDLKGQLESQGVSATLDTQRGLDHGAWIPLMHLYPDADVPVIQVSLQLDSDELSAFTLGQALAPLAKEDVLIIGSGSLTHNLYEVRMGETEAASYAQAFTAWVRQAVLDADMVRLTKTLALAPHAARAHPTSEHFLPLLVAAGASDQAKAVTVLEGGIRHGVLAMESYVFGRQFAVKVKEHQEC